MHVGCHEVKNHDLPIENVQGLICHHQTTGPAASSTVSCRKTFSITIATNFPFEADLMTLAIK